MYARHKGRRAIVSFLYQLKLGSGGAKGLRDSGYDGGQAFLNSWAGTLRNNRQARAVLYFAVLEADPWQQPDDIILNNVSQELHAGQACPEAGIRQRASGGPSEHRFPATI